MDAYGCAKNKVPCGRRYRRSSCIWHAQFVTYICISQRCKRCITIWMKCPGMLFCIAGGWTWIRGVPRLGSTRPNSSCISNANQERAAFARSYNRNGQFLSFRQCIIGPINNLQLQWHASQRGSHGILLNMVFSQFPHTIYLEKNQFYSSKLKSQSIHTSISFQEWSIAVVKSCSLRS